MMKYLLVAYKESEYAYSNSKFELFFENSLEEILTQYKKYLEEFDCHIFKIDYDEEDAIIRAMQKTQCDYWEERRKKQKIKEEESFKKQEELNYKKYLELKEKYESK